MTLLLFLRPLFMEGVVAAQIPRGRQTTIYPSSRRHKQDGAEGHEEGLLIANPEALSRHLPSLRMHLMRSALNLCISTNYILSLVPLPLPLLLLLYSAITVVHFLLRLPRQVVFLSCAKGFIISLLSGP